MHTSIGVTYIRATTIYTFNYEQLKSKIHEIFSLLLIFTKFSENHFLTFVPLCTVKNNYLKHCYSINMKLAI